MNTKVAIIVATYPPYSGGMGNVASAQSRLLSERGYRVNVFTPGEKSETSIKSKVGVTRLRSFLRYGQASCLPAIKGATSGADIIFLHYPFFGVAEIFSIFGVKKNQKLVIYYHMDNVGQGVWKFIFAFYHKLFLGRLLKRANAVLVSTKDYARTSLLSPYVSGLGHRLQEVPLFVDAEYFKPDPKPLGLLEQYKLQDSTPTVLFVGGLDQAHYFKGVPVLLKAWRNVEQHIPKAKLFIVGDGDKRLEYESGAKELKLNNVIFVGHVAEVDLPKYYQLSDLFVLPSVDRSEAFGLVVLEAMASGRAVIASNLPGVRSVVREGETGRLVKPYDYKALSSSIVHFLANLSQNKEMGTKARLAVEDRYSKKIVGDKLINILNSL